MTEEHSNYTSITSKSLPIPPNTHHFNHIADIILTPALIPAHVAHLSGYVQVYTTSDTDEPSLRIPFDEIVFHGSLEHERENTRLNFSSISSGQCEPIKVINRFPFPLAVFNFTTTNIDDLLPYITVTTQTMPDRQSHLILCFRSLIRPRLSISIPINGLN